MPDTSKRITLNQIASDAGVAPTSDPFELIDRIAARTDRPLANLFETIAMWDAGFCAAPTRGGKCQRRKLHVGDCSAFPGDAR